MRPSETPVTRTDLPNLPLEFGDLTTPRLLVVAAETRPLDPLPSCFASGGFEVLAAPSAEEALAILSVHGADVALVDLSLGDDAGFDLLAAIRHSTLWRDLAVIVLAPLHEPQWKVRALEAGADDCVAKPFHPDDLQARVRALLRRAHGVSA